MHDYSHQNLKGRSFRGQNLTNADFSGADLRGVDFRDADLSDAQFCGARMGITLHRSLLMFLLGVVLVGCSGILSTIFSMFANWFIGFIPNNYALTLSTPQRIIAIVSYVLYCIAGALITLNRQNWSLLWFWQLWIIAIAEAPMILHAEAATFFNIVTEGIRIASAAMVTTAIAITGAGVGAVAIAAAIAAAVTKKVAITGAIVGMLVGLAIVLIAGEGLIAVAGTEIGKESGAKEGVAMGAVLWFALAFYLNMRSLKYEEPMLQTLRRWILAWHSWGGTDFRDSNLQGADFSRANLRHAQFCGTQLIGCRWQNAQNLHLADTRHSLLEPRPVRVLLSSGEITTRDFSLFNLRGVVLAGLDLRGINFYHADLSLAGFRGCDLSNCDLSEVMALGTDFSQATLTGTIIDGWNIDKTTRFDEAECHFVYLKRDKSERNPPQGEFGDGDFAKLYQEIANTVDFIAHTPAELQALLRAIETIKAQGGSIFIQQMERKAESVVLRVQSEPNAEIDKPDIYAEVQRQKAIELLAIRQEYEQKFLQGELKHMQELRTAEKENMDLLAQLLRSAIDKPTSVTFENNFMTQDHSRRIENVTMNNSNANLGDNSSQRIRIEQLPDGQLKILLQKLSDLIDQAPLTKHDRQLVEEQLNQLTMLSTQSKPESRDEVGKTLGLLKDLSTIFKDLPNIGSQYGVLLGELVQLLI